jgi:hypothetical protein
MLRKAMKVMDISGQSCQGELKVENQSASSTGLKRKTPMTNKGVKETPNSPSKNCQNVRNCYSKMDSSE